MTTRFEVLVRSEQSEGRLGVIRNTVPASFAGPPLHHHAFDEMFYVLEGELTFRLGDALVTAGPGEAAFAPGGTPHTLANRSGAPARYLLICTPGGFERYFDRLDAEITGVAPPPEASGPYPETIVVGPRIGEEASS
ncbi:MAG: cupin domain-containing protein [Thermoleophilia bacterium]|nr:cupin domain-containing protein [Thermoleophilia bacterium]